jgi:hypothetical protein
MELVTGNIGWIEVVCGPMFSGKSEELIRRLRRARIARKRVQVFKPALDDRYSVDEIVSHGDQRMKSEAVNGAQEILQKLDWRPGWTRITWGVRSRPCRSCSAWPNPLRRRWLSACAVEIPPNTRKDWWSRTI